MFGLQSAVNAAAYGLVTWHFVTSATLLFAASLAFIIQARGPEALVSAGGGLFLGYVGKVIGRRFGQAIRGGDDQFRY